jgi:predicted nucleic acid-binding Zn ribbon protein
VRKLTERMMEVTSLRQALHRLLRAWGVNGRVRENQAVACWDEIVGPLLAEHTQALRVEDGKIFIRVSSSSWKTELLFVKREIIERLNQAVGSNVITDVIFVGSGKRSGSSPKAKAID